MDRAQLESGFAVGDAVLMNREIEQIREAMRVRNIDQAELSKRLEPILGKKYRGRPGSQVSRQLSQGKMSPSLIHAYWQALGGRPSERVASVAPSGDTLADAMRALTKLTPEQLQKALGYISGLIDAPAAHRR